MNAPLDFPNNPHHGQIFYQWMWDGQKWIQLSTLGWAPIYSPDFKGMPTAPTPPPGSNDAKIATTAFVMEAIEHHIAGVSSFNHRTGHVFLELVDIVEAGGAPIHGPHFTGWPEANTAEPGTDSRIIATTEFVQDAIRRATDNIVNSWNRRTGDVELRWDDVEDVGGAPIREPFFLGFARGQTAPRRDETTRLANTIFVGRAIDDLRDDIDEEIEEVVRTSVRSWNQRTGHVVLRPSDLSAVGAAFLASPAFTGKPTAPTAPPDTNNQQLATTRYVDQAIRSNPGPPGAPGRPGAEGPAGPPGRGLVVVGHVDDRGDLPRQGNQVGDIWTVGEDYEGFWWNGFRWISMGFIRGARGERGPAGPPTFIDWREPERPEHGDLWWNPFTQFLRVFDEPRDYWDKITGVNVIYTNASENLPSYTNWVYSWNFTANGTTWILPPRASVPEGRMIRLTPDRIAYDFVLGPSPGETIAFLTQTGFISSAPGEFITFRNASGFNPASAPTHSIILISSNAGPDWVCLNDGPPIVLSTSVGLISLSGKVPPPPNSTISNAVLQANMTWQVPGRNFRVVSSDYTVLPTDDFITASVPSSTSLELILPLVAAITGKRIRVRVFFVSTGSFRISSAASGYMALYVKGPTIENSSLEFSYQTPGTGLDLVINSTGLSDFEFEVVFNGAWYLLNKGQPISGTVTGGGRVYLPGLIPPPRDGTPDTAVLHADMTWY